MKILLVAPLLPFMLGGCMTPEKTVSDAAINPVDAAECDATSSQSLVGQKTSKELGERIIKNSGALIFRWLPPGMMVTMEYNPVRVNVAYDERMIVTSITCG